MLMTPPSVYGLHGNEDAKRKQETAEQQQEVSEIQKEQDLKAEAATDAKQLIESMKEWTPKRMENLRKEAHQTIEGFPRLIRSFVVEERLKYDTDKYPFREVRINMYIVRTGCVF